MKNFPLIFCMLFIWSCSANTNFDPQIADTPPETADIYVIREANKPINENGEYLWQIAIDDRKLCELGRGEYGLLRTSAGASHSLDIKGDGWWHEKGELFVAEPLESRYFLVAIHDHRMTIERIDKTTAEPYMNTYPMVCGNKIQVAEAEPAEMMESGPTIRIPSETIATPEIFNKPSPPPEQEPVPEPEPTPEPVKQVVKPLPQEIYFDLDKAQIKPEMLPQLDEIVDYLQTNSGKSILLQGHACDLGTDKYNEILSQNRARAVRDFLIDRGINPNRIQIKAFGEKQPEYDNSTEEGRAKNRRVEFRYAVDPSP